MDGSEEKCRGHPIWLASWEEESESLKRGHARGDTLRAPGRNDPCPRFRGLSFRLVPCHARPIQEVARAYGPGADNIKTSTMKIFTATCAVAFSICASNGATLAEYNFNGGSGTTLDYSATTTGAGATASAVSPTGTFVRSGSDLNGVTGGGSLAAQFQSVGKENPPISGTAAQSYISFTVGAAGPGQALSLTSLSFLTNLSTAQASGAFYTLQYGNASTPSSFINLSLSPSTVQTATTVVTRTADLSAIDFSAFTTGVTFRINITQPTDSGNTGTASARIDTINVQGSVIPEPGTISLLVGSAVFGLPRRRRK